MKPTLVVLAAGIGSRYGGLKQIDPVGPNGETIIDYSVYDAIRAGFGRVVFIIRRAIEKDFKEAVGSKFSDVIDVDYVFQELDMLPEGFSVPEERQKPWGTGHAVLSAASVVRESFAVINADDFYGREGFELLSKYLSDVPAGSEDYALAGFTLRNTLSDHGSVARGVCQCGPDGKLIAVTEHLKIERDGAGAVDRGDDGGETRFTGDEHVSMNMWGFTPKYFDRLQRDFVAFLQKDLHTPKAEFLIPTVVDDAIKKGEASVQVLPTSANWFGVTYTEDRPQVVASIRELVDRGLYPEKLWAAAD